MRISDWSSDVCSSDLAAGVAVGIAEFEAVDGIVVEVRRDAADRDIASLTLVVLDADAGQPLDHLGDVAVGKLADLVGRDDINNTDGIALDLDRTFLLRALPRDDDRFAFVGRRQILGENRRGCEQCKSADTGEAKLVSHMSSPDCCGAPSTGQRQFCNQSVTAMLRDRKSTRLNSSPYCASRR